MTYVKTNWQTGVTPLNATNMNNIENGIEAVDEKVGQALINKGTWVSGSDYAVNDLVKYNGVIYLCKQAVVNSTTEPSSDTTNFEQFSGGGGGSTWYQHTIDIYLSVEGVSTIIITNNATSFTLNTLYSWLLNQGYNDSGYYYPVVQSLGDSFGEASDTVREYKGICATTLDVSQTETIGFNTHEETFSINNGNVLVNHSWFTDDSTQISSLDIVDHVTQL